MSSNIQMKIGEQIRKIRESKKIGLRDFEIMVGISRANLSKIERGMRNPTLETIQRIAKALDCEVEILINPKKNKKTFG